MAVPHPARQKYLLISEEARPIVWDFSVSLHSTLLKIRPLSCRQSSFSTPLETCAVTLEHRPQNFSSRDPKLAIARQFVQFYPSEILGWL